MHIHTYSMKFHIIIIITIYIMIFAFFTVYIQFILVTKPLVKVVFYAACMRMWLVGPMYVYMHVLHLSPLLCSIKSGQLN